MGTGSDVGDTKVRVLTGVKKILLLPSKQRDDLERINFKKKVLTLLERICEREVEEVVVAHKDRFSRFGFELIKWFIEKHDGKILVLDAASQSC